jgi:hypothetical protein
MKFRCPKCKREYVMKLADFRQGFTCECGYSLAFEDEEIFDHLQSICREYELEIEESKLAEIKNAQDKIIVLILDTDYPKVDIEIEKAKFRELIKKLFPEKAHLYELIYEPRFKRLWEQFREAENADEK